MVDQVILPKSGLGQSFRLKITDGQIMSCHFLDFVERF